MLSRRPAARGRRPSSGERNAQGDRDAPPPREEGDLLAPGYRAVRLLARGGRVDTYDAWSEERECRVVVKQVRPDRAGERHVQAALLEEGRLLLSATHPHLARAYAVLEATTSAPATVVLETLPGTLLSAVVDDGPVATADVARLGLQLCSALRYLHHRDRLHLDLKPDNVVVREGQAVLIDLGMAAPPGPGRPGLGTRGYLAPEQARGEAITAATDVWGLGVTLAETATGDLPYGDEATWDSGPRPAGRRRPRRPRLRGVDADLRAVLTGCLHLDPAERLPLPAVRDALVELT